MPETESEMPELESNAETPGGAGRTADTRSVQAAIDSGSPFATMTHDALGDTQADLEVSDFSLSYGPKKALFGISMRIPTGKVTSLIGPSGCGKSTLLRSVNRMNDLIEGAVINR